MYFGRCVRRCVLGGVSRGKLIRGICTLGMVSRGKLIRGICTLGMVSRGRIIRDTLCVFWVWRAVEGKGFCWGGGEFIVNMTV